MRPSKRSVLGLSALVLGTTAPLSFGQPALSAKPTLRSLAHQQTLKSEAMDSELTYHLYLPEAYETEPEQRFPVVYWLHGSGGSSQIASSVVSRLFDSAIGGGRVPPMLVVFPDGLRQSMWVNSKDGKVPMEDVLVRELLPHIDAEFRTVAAARGRIVEGGSMGGYGAVRLAFKFPELFGAVSMLSAGPLQEVLRVEDAPIVGAKGAQVVLDRVYGGDLDYFRTQSPWVLAEQNAAAIRDKVVVRQIVGEQDGVLKHNQMFSRRLTELGIDHTFEVLEGVGHTPRDLFAALAESESYWAFFRTALDGAQGEGSEAKKYTSDTERGASLELER